MSLGRFQGQVAIVTGGSSGIGFATMTRLLEEGARVAVFDLTPLPSIVAKNNSVRFFEVDVTQNLSVGEAVAQVVSEWNTINVVVNCAGVAAIGTVVDND